MTRARGLIRNYAQDVRLVRSPTGLFMVVGLVLVYLFLPFALDDTWANVFVIAGFTAIGALGLNLLTGYTGLPSLGTAGFVAIGAFTASYLGRPKDFDGLEWNFLAYAAIAMVIGGLVGFVVGLPALRLRGVYLSIATLAMVFITIFALNQWETISGGNSGTSVPIKVTLGTDALGNFRTNPETFEGLTIFGKHHGNNQSFFYLVWAFVAIVALLCKNIVRSRPGRALQAVRDRDVAAAVVGVSLFRSKVGAFVISSALASLAGVFYAIWQGYIEAKTSFFGLDMSIQYLAIIVVGGIGTSYGPILGAVMIAAIEPKIVPFIADLFPFLFSKNPGSAGFSEGNFAALLYAVSIILFLVMEPRGLAGILRRVGGYFRSWPLAR
jgi:branched-chain amino acid transport system permease protein